MSNAPVDELGYEAARDQLSHIVRRLESGGVGLADTMSLWEEGERLAKVCQGWLDGAKAKIDAAREAHEAGEERQHDAPATPLDLP